MLENVLRPPFLTALVSSRPSLARRLFLRAAATLVVVPGFCLTAYAQSTQLVFLTPIPTAINAGGSAGLVQVAEETAAGAIVNRTGDTITITVTSSAPSYSATYTATTVGGIAQFNLAAQSNVASQPAPYLLTAGNASATYAYSATGVVGTGGASLGTAATAGQTVSNGSVYIVTQASLPGATSCTDQNIASPVTSTTCAYDKAVNGANANTGNGGVAWTANSSGPRITIVFASSLYASGPATLTLTTNPSNLTKSTAIAGPGPANIILSGANAYEPIKVSSSSTGTALFFSGFTIANGSLASNGAAFSDAQAGITVSFNNMAITNNTASSNGGALYFKSSTNSAVTITNSTFTGNSETGSSATGGAIYYAGTGLLTISNCYFANNTSSTGLDTGGSGGALFTAATASMAGVTLINDTFYNNTAGTAGGGAIALNNTGVTKIINSTFIGNSTTGAGGGASIAAAIGATSTAPLTIYNTVIEDNTATTAAADLNYTAANGFITAANNLFDTTSTSSYPSLAALGLGTPANYGGPTFVAPILPGSPLIGQGSAADTGTPTTDQRGFSRPAVSGGAVDIGAEQSNLTFAYTVQPSNTTTGTLISPSPVVSVADTGYGITGVPIAVSLSSGTFTGGSTTSVNTNASGLATFSNLTPTTAATGVVLNASSGVAPATVASSTFNVTAPPSQLAFGTPPASTIAQGGNAGSAITVNIEDSGGNTLNATNAITLTVTGPSSYSQTYGPTSAVAGTATFNLSGIPLNTPGTYTYTATCCTPSPTLTSAVASETVTGAPTIVFTVPNYTTYDTAPFTVSASSNSGGAITYSLVSGPASVTSGGTVTLTGVAGTVVIQASQAAAGAYTAGSQQAFFTVLAGSVWLGNGNSSLSKFDALGSPVSPGGGYTGGGLVSIVGPLGMAFDSSGNVWVANSGSTGISQFSASGTPNGAGPFTGNGGIGSPTGLAIDGLGQVWVANSDTGTITVLANSGAAITPSTGYVTGAPTVPTGIAIDISGNVWIANSGATGGVTELIGGAAPVAPLATAVANSTIGARP